MSAEFNKAIVIKWFDFLNHSDVQGFLSLYHPEMTIWTSGGTLLSGTKSKDEIAPVASQIFDYFPEGLSYVLLTILAERNIVAAEAIGEGHHVSGRIYRNHYHFQFTMKDGYIFHIKEFMDTEIVTDILCGGQTK